MLQDLLVFRDTRVERTELTYWRTVIGDEVDFVVETDDRLLPIEVKATTRPRIGDAKHLQTFVSEYRDRAPAGLLLHSGTKLEWLTANVLAAPWWRVL